MLSTPKSAIIDQSRARSEHRRDEKLTIGACLMVWVSLSALGWVAILSLMN